MLGRFPGISLWGTRRLGHPCGTKLRRGLPEGKRLGLREHVRDQQIVLLAGRVERLREADEVAGHDRRSLMKKLVKAVLAVRSGLTPENRTGVGADGFPSSVTDLPFDSIASCWR